MEKLKTILASVDTWCFYEKSKILYDLILERKPKISVEIGVYGGGSFLCMSLAVKEIDGLIYGIDHWNINDALQGIPNIDDLTRNVDFETLYIKLLYLIHKERLTNNSHLIRLTSLNASKFFNDISVDFIHIDGNHSYEKVKLDLETWLPKLTTNALVVMDDTDWDGVSRAIKEFPSLIKIADHGIWCIFTKN